MPIWKSGKEKQADWCRLMGKKYGGKKRVLVDRKCKICGNIFRPHNSLSKFCSYKCSLLGRTKRGTTETCKLCGKSYYCLPCFKKTSKYCSQICQRKSQRKPSTWMTKKCKFCGKDYEVRKVQVKHRGSNFCSMKCLRTFTKLKAYELKIHKKTNNAKLKKQFWGIFSQYIRQRDGGKCISCGKVDFWRKMDAGHYIPKTAGLSLYFDEQNVNCQCTYCNRWMHGNLAPYALALQDKYGENILRELDERRRIITKISDAEYLQRIEDIKVKLANLLSKTHDLQI